MKLKKMLLMLRGFREKIRKKNVRDRERFVMNGEGGMKINKWNIKKEI